MAVFSSILSFVYCIEITSTIEGTFLTHQLASDVLVMVEIQHGSFP